MWKNAIHCLFTEKEYECQFLCKMKFYMSRMMEFLFIFKEALVNMMGKMLYIAGELNLCLVLLLWETIDTYRGTYYIFVYIHRRKSKHDGKKCYVHNHKNLDLWLILLLRDAIDTYRRIYYVVVYIQWGRTNKHKWKKLYTAIWTGSLFGVAITRSEDYRS